MNQSVAPSHISGTAVEVNGRTYAAPKRPTVVIIVDGFDPAYLKHGIANGTLPTMKSFKERGFMATADCSMPSTTNTNNTSIVTGVPPAVHGINGKLLPRRRNRRRDHDHRRQAVAVQAPYSAALSRAGVKATAVVTAKDKLLKVLASMK